MSDRQEKENEGRERERGAGLQETEKKTEEISEREREKVFSFLSENPCPKTIRAHCLSQVHTNIPSNLKQRWPKGKVLDRGERMWGGRCVGYGLGGASMTSGGARSSKVLMRETHHGCAPRSVHTHDMTLLPCPKLPAWSELRIVAAF